MIDTLQAHGRTAEVLLVEDNENDAMLTKLGFERAHLAVNLHHVANGEECMSFLRKEGKYADAPTPDLILLDINMPRMDGLEVLEAIGKDASLRHLPVVILTSSQAEEDVMRSYKLRCSSYLVKPITFEGFAALIQSLTNYWFALVVLPPS